VLLIIDAQHVASADLKAPTSTTGDGKMRIKSGRWVRAAMSGAAALVLAALAACGGGGGSGDSTGAVTGTGTGSTGGTTALGTLSVSLTDSPACGFDQVWISVQKVRVHRSASAGDDDAGWVDIPLPAAPMRVDLLTLTNGALVSLGEVQLPAGSYTQMRLVLAPNTASDPYANAVVPSGGAIVPLKTPSAQQSGLKMNVGIDVPAGQQADVAIDFDACRSIVVAGKSGKVLLKPVLSVLPILSPAGQRIQGWLDPLLLVTGTTVSVQSGGQVVRSTPPVRDAGGNLGFTLYPVPVGSYELVVTAAGRATAVVTGVPSYAATSTTLNSVVTPIVPPISDAQSVGGTVTYAGSAVNTGGVVRALQTLGVATTVQVASANADDEDGGYAMALPIAAPVLAAYGSAPLGFAPDLAAQSRYTLSATVAGSSVVQTWPIVVDSGPVLHDFVFAAGP
jgi:hypothetical protein